MVAYIIAGLVLLVLLFFAYRLLGGREASTPLDPDVLLRAALERTQHADRLIDGSTARGIAAGGGSSDRAATLREARRSLDDAGHQLQQVEVARVPDVSAAAHALLSAAVEELSWAARLMQSPAYGTATGLHDAVGQLLLHAHGCVLQATELEAVSAVSEEVDSPA